MKTICYILGFCIALLLASLVFGCTKSPMAVFVKMPPKITSTTDTLNFYIYAANFDSVHTFPYNSVEIKVIGTKDSMIIPVLVDFNHTYKGYVLDTVSNKSQHSDSAFVRLPILTVGDTIKYYIMNSTGKIHAADFVVKPSYTFTRVWENSLFAPYGNSGIHISPGYVNDIYIP